MSAATDTADISKICSQRRFNMLYNVPPTRYTPVSPYTYTLNGQLKYTKQQLDMRRKVEILKYDKSSSQVSKQTKKEKWVQINNQKYPVYKILAKNNCDTIETSSKLSNIPGPAVPLKLDSNVPLYNFGTPIRSYAILNNMNDIPYELIVTGDTSYFYDSQFAFLAYIRILSSIDETSKLFSIQIPFAIGYNKTSSTSTTISGNIFLQVTNNISNTTKIYYSGSVVNSGMHRISFDISGAYFPPNSSNTVETDIIGTITIDNIYLPTHSGYLYEVQQMFDINTDISLAVITPYIKVHTNNITIYAL
jgi:hypothetical protein